MSPADTSPAPPGGGPRRGRGRPRRAEAAELPATRDRILAAAREAFAERGYDKTSIREIARAAEVNPALVHHYYGTKEKIFSAVVAAAAAPATAGPPVGQQYPPEEVGLAFTRLFFGIWENPATRGPVLALLRSAVSNETAAGIFRSFVSAQLLSRVTEGLDLPDAELRAELAAAQLVGTAVLRYVLCFEPLAKADLEELIKRLAPVVQHHLTGPGPSTPA